MSALGRPLPVHRDVIPQLRFAIERAEAVRYAAVPTLRFGLKVEAGAGQAVRSVLLDVQIQVAARQRGYNGTEEGLLQELFGTPERWSTTLRTLPWARTTVVVPPFEGSTEAEVLVACSYDLEVAGARYLAALTEGVVPLEFLFSGSVFFATPQANLQMTRIATDCEATYQLPVSAWREAIDRHFPDGAWLRLGRDRYQALCGYKARHGFASWDAAVDALLDQGAEDER